MLITGETLLMNTCFCRLSQVNGQCFTGRKAPGLGLLHRKQGELDSTPEIKSVL